MVRAKVARPARVVSGESTLDMSFKDPLCLVTDQVSDGEGKKIPDPVGGCSTLAAARSLRPDTPREPTIVTAESKPLDQTLKENMANQPLDLTCLPCRSYPREKIAKLPEAHRRGLPRIIVEDLLSAKSREYLRSPQHDPCRAEDRTRVQVDRTFIFSNQSFKISTIFLVVPRRAISNGSIGIILGQRGLLNRIAYRSVPREISKARRDNVEEGVRGDIIIEECLTLDNELLSS